MIKQIMAGIFWFISNNTVFRKLFSLLPVDIKIKIKKLLRLVWVNKYNKLGNVVEINKELAQIEKPLVSIVLPVYNHDAFLPKAIESILKQSYPYFELIIVDDGSDKLLLNNIKDYVNDPRVRYIRQIHSGLPTALNTGFYYAFGDYFTWTSADNIMGKNNIEEMLNVLLNYRKIAMVYCDYSIIDENGNKLEASDFRIHNQDYASSNIIRLPNRPSLLASRHDNFVGPCFMYRRSMTTIGLYDDSIGVEDYDYWVRAQTFFQLVHFSDVSTFYQYRVHNDTLSNKARELNISQKAQKVLAKAKKRISVLKKHANVVIDLDDKTRQCEIAESIKKYCRIIEADGSIDGYILITSFKKYTEGLANKNYNKVIVLVDKNEGLPDNLNNNKSYYICTNIGMYQRLKKIINNVYYIDEENISSVIGAILSSFFYDKHVNKLNVELYKTRKINICTDLRDNHNDLLRGIIEKLRENDHDIRGLNEACLRECNICIFDLNYQFLVKDSSVLNYMPIVFIANSDINFAELDYCLDKDAIYVCGNTSVFMKLEQKGLSHNQIFIINEKDDYSLKKFEAMLLQSINESHYLKGRTNFETRCSYC